LKNAWQAGTFKNQSLRAGFIDMPLIHCIMKIRAETVENGVCP